MNHSRLQITEAGKRRVKTEDFAKSLVHITSLASKQAAVLGLEDSFAFVMTYTAMNLILGEDGIGELPDNEGEALSEFINRENYFIRKTIGDVITSPVFLNHSIECFGLPEGVGAA